MKIAKILNLIAVAALGISFSCTLVAMEGTTKGDEKKLNAEYLQNLGKILQNIKDTSFNAALDTPVVEDTSCDSNVNLDAETETEEKDRPIEEDRPIEKDPFEKDPLSKDNSLPCVLDNGEAEKLQDLFEESNQGLRQNKLWERKLPNNLREQLKQAVSALPPRTRGKIPNFEADNSSSGSTVHNTVPLTVVSPSQTTIDDYSLVNLNPVDSKPTPEIKTADTIENEKSQINDSSLMSNTDTKDTKEQSSSSDKEESVTSDKENSTEEGEYSTQEQSSSSDKEEGVTSDKEAQSASSDAEESVTSDKENSTEEGKKDVEDSTEEHSSGSDEEESVTTIDDYSLVELNPVDSKLTPDIETADTIENEKSQINDSSVMSNTDTKDTKEQSSSSDKEGKTSLTDPIVISESTEGQKDTRGQSASSDEEEDVASDEENSTEEMVKKNTEKQDNLTEEQARSSSWMTRLSSWLRFSDAQKQTNDQNTKEADKTANEEPKSTKRILIDEDKEEEAQENQTPSQKKEPALNNMELNKEALKGNTPQEENPEQPKVIQPEGVSSNLRPTDIAIQEQMEIVRQSGAHNGVVAGLVKDMILEQEKKLAAEQEKLEQAKKIEDKLDRKSEVKDKKEEKVPVVPVDTGAMALKVQQCIAIISNMWTTRGGFFGVASSKGGGDAPKPENNDPFNKIGSSPTAKEIRDNLAKSLGNGPENQQLPGMQPGQSHDGTVGQPDVQPVVDTNAVVQQQPQSWISWLRPTETTAAALMFFAGYYLWSNMPQKCPYTDKSRSCDLWKFYQLLQFKKYEEAYNFVLQNRDSMKASFNQEAKKRIEIIVHNSINDLLNQRIQYEESYLSWSKPKGTDIWYLTSLWGMIRSDFKTYLTSDFNALLELIKNKDLTTITNNQKMDTISSTPNVRQHKWLEDDKTKICDALKEWESTTIDDHEKAGVHDLQYNQLVCP